MAERIMVTEAELKRRWFSDEATGMIHDHQTGHKVVRMADGTEYATAFVDLVAASRPADADDEVSTGG